MQMLRKRVVSHIYGMIFWNNSFLEPQALQQLFFAEWRVIDALVL